MFNYLRAMYYLYNMLRRTHWKREQLTKHQSQKVREIIKYAYENVPYYHDSFRRIAIKPSDIKNVGDLSKLPILRRKEIAENAERIISKNFNPKKLKKVSTSGSTGRPLSTYLTSKEDEFRKAKHLRANIAVGQKPRDSWIVITAPQHFSEITRLQRIFRIYAAVPLSVFDDQTTQVSTLQQLKPDVLDGYSTSLLLLAREVEKSGIETIKPKFIIGGAELTDNSSRVFIEKSFEAPFYDQYACIELERLAWQCREKLGYHIDVDSVVMQFVDEDGEEVAPGERGEIVCTSLFNYAMPFIRYAIGDIGIASEETTCPCGRTFPLMKVVEGRKDSFTVLPDGRTLPPLLFGWIMEFYKFYCYIDHYRIIQKRVDFFKVLIKKKESDVNEKDMEAELLVHMRKMLNVSNSELTIEIEFVDEVPLDKSGKFTKVVSDLRGFGVFP